MDLKTMTSFGNVKVGAHFSLDEGTFFPLVKPKGDMVGEGPGIDYIKLSGKTARPVTGNNDTVFLVKSTESVLASRIDIPGPPKGEETVMAQKLREAGLLNDEDDFEEG